MSPVVIADVKRQGAERPVSVVIEPGTPLARRVTPQKVQLLLGALGCTGISAGAPCREVIVLVVIARWTFVSGLGAASVRLLVRTI